MTDPTGMGQGENIHDADGYLLFIICSAVKADLLHKQTTRASFCLLLVTVYDCRTGCIERLF